MVAAKCLAFAWDSVQCRAYEPGQGPLEGGRYEIDADSQLATLTTLRGDWLFQYPGHEGKAPAKAKAAPAVQVESSKLEPEHAPRSKVRKMSAEHKKKMLEGRERKKAERLARLAEA